MRPAWKWGLIGAAAVLGGLAVLIATAPPPSPVPWHFWTRMDEDPRLVYPAINRASDPRWTVTWSPPKDSRVEVIVLRDHPSEVIEALRGVGVLRWADGLLAGVALPTPEKDAAWRECLTTNAPWPEDAVIDAAFAGDWEEAAGSPPGSGPTPPARSRRYEADGSMTRPDWPKLECRWARIDDVVVIGVWNPPEKRWHTGDALLLAPDGESYRTIDGRIGRRVR